MLLQGKVLQNAPPVEQATLRANRAGGYAAGVAPSARILPLAASNFCPPGIQNMQLPPEGATRTARR